MAYVERHLCAKSHAYWLKYRQTKKFCFFGNLWPLESSQTWLNHKFDVNILCRKKKIYLCQISWTLANIIPSNDKTFNCLYLWNSDPYKLSKMGQRTNLFYALWTGIGMQCIVSSDRLWGTAAQNIRFQVVWPDHITSFKRVNREKKWRRRKQQNQFMSLQDIVIPWAKAVMTTSRLLQPLAGHHSVKPNQYSTGGVCVSISIPNMTNISNMFTTPSVNIRATWSLHCGVSRVNSFSMLLLKLDNRYLRSTWGAF